MATTPAVSTVVPGAEIAQSLALYRMLPPFYALQPHLPTRERQLELWAALLVALVDQLTDAIPDAVSHARTAKDAHGDDGDDDDVLQRISPVALRLNAASAVFENASLGRRMSTSDAQQVLEYAATSSLFAQRRIFAEPQGASDAATASFIVTGFDGPAVGAALNKWAAGHAAAGEDGVLSSVHTVTELLEDAVFPRTAVKTTNAQQRSELAATPGFDRLASTCLESCLVQEGALLTTLLHSEDFLTSFRATPIYHPVSGALRGIRVAQ